MTRSSSRTEPVQSSWLATVSPEQTDMDRAMANELVEFENGEYGMALNLEEDSVSIVILGSDVGLHEGSAVPAERVASCFRAGRRRTDWPCRQLAWTRALTARGEIKTKSSFPPRLRAPLRESLSARASAYRFRPVLRQLTA